MSEKITCPKCKHRFRPEDYVKAPTNRQIEALYWTHILGLSLDDAGRMMGIKKSAVSRLLSRIERLRPIMKRFDERKRVKVPVPDDEVDWAEMQLVRIKSLHK